MSQHADIKFSDLANLNKASILRRTSGDKVIWGLVIVLVLMSLLVVYSATGSLAYKMYKGNTEVYLFKQIAFIIIGLLLIYFAHRVNYTIYSRLAKFFFILSIPLLVYTLFFGVTLNEGSRWIRLPIINMTMQTSDLAKLSLFMFLARLLSRRQHKIKDFRKGFLPVIIPVAIVIMLIAPANLSTALLLGASCMLLLFIGRISAKHLLLTIGIALIPVVFLVLAATIKHKSSGGETTSSESRSSSGIFNRVDTWISRVEGFMYGSKDEDHQTNYHVNQMKIAIANGGFLGVGPGNSEQRNFMPHPYSDSIYATIIEEYGLMGGAFMIFIYLVFLYRSIRLFKKCPYAFGAFLAVGLSFTLVLQALANMAVNVSLFPVTGVTLPLVSMGGSSFLFTCLSIGIILSVARNVEQLEGKAVAEAIAKEEEKEKQKEKEEEDEEKPAVKKKKAVELEEA
jgi:cell division protein FtsW